MRRKTKRARNGEGSAWQDKNGRWIHRITVNGKRYTVADRDAERAKAKLEALKAQLDKKINIDGSKQTLSQFLEYWLNVVSKPGLKESSVVDQQKRINRYIVPTLGEYRLCDLTPGIIRSWVNALYERFALSSTKQGLAIIKRALNTAVEYRYLEYNPAASISAPRPRNDKITDDDDEDEGVGKVMTPQQIEALLQAVAGDWLEPLYILAFLGPRRGELLGFRWTDYDGKTLKIRQQVIQLDGKVMITTPKTRSSKRTIPLDDELIAMINQYRVRYDTRRAKATTWEDNDLMFCSANGKPIQPSNLLRHFRRALEKAKLGEYIDDRFKTAFRFHDLRHTASQSLQDAGVHPKVRAAILGHASVKITEQVYSHASVEAKHEAIKKVRKKG